MRFLTFDDITEEFERDVAAGIRCPCLAVDERGDSELESMFWHMMKKTLGRFHGAAQQVWIGRYRVDALLDCGGKLVVVELDGKAFHDAERDRIRDAEIIKSVDAIIRIPFPAMYFFQRATFKVLGQWFPRFDLGYWGTLLNAEEFHDEYYKLKDDPDFQFDNYTAEIERLYELWDVEPSGGRVGSPKGFLGQTRNIYNITIQRGTGHAPALMDHLYERANCNRNAQLSRMEIAKGRED